MPFLPDFLMCLVSITFSRSDSDLFLVLLLEGSEDIFDTGTFFLDDFPLSPSLSFGDFSFLPSFFLFDSIAPLWVFFPSLGSVLGVSLFFF